MKLSLKFSAGFVHNFRSIALLNVGHVELQIIFAIIVNGPERSYQMLNTDWSLNLYMSMSTKRAKGEFKITTRASRP